MRRAAVLLLGVAALAGCGGVGGKGESEKNKDHSAELEQSIRSEAASQVEDNLRQSGTTNPVVSVTGVSCVRSGSTQSYSCLLDVNETDDQSSEPYHEKVSATGTCDAKGNCTWSSD